MQLLFHDGIDAGDGGDVDDIAHRTFDVGKVNRFVQSHLNRAYHFCFTHVLDELIGGVGRSQVGEYQCIDFLALQAGERIFFITQFVVQCERRLPNRGIRGACN